MSSGSQQKPYPPPPSHRPLLLTTAVDVVAGVNAGVLAAFVGQPLDTVRIRTQTQPQLFSGPLDCLVKTIQWDGVRGLFAVSPLKTDCIPPFK